MDSRITLRVDETFLEILASCLKQQEKAHLLIDEKGLTRTDGFVSAIHKSPSGIFIELKDGRRINLQMIVALNGIFRPEYGEC